MSAPLEISPQEVQQRIDAGEKLHLLDVRERHEFQTSCIPGATLIPMREIPGEIQEIETHAAQAPLIVFCHHGVRSLNVVYWLREQGIENCMSMAGGIDAWSRTVDPAVPRY